MHQATLLSRTNWNSGDRDARLVEGALARLDLFREVEPHNITEVALQSRTQQARRGTVVCNRGHRLPGVIVMAYGMAKAGLRRGDGEEKVLRFIGANETFGVASVLLDRPCPLDLVVVADSLITVLPARPLRRLLESDSRFARNVTANLAGSVLGMVTEFQANAQCSAIQRLASYLGTLARPVAAAQAGTVRLPASKTLIAARLGVTKETMSRLLRDLAGRGLISVAGREIGILDGAGLALIAGYAGD
jgi:CRP/FNR family transcriptional regulator, dissimilatory nitrate respiration regulator